MSGSQDVHCLVSGCVESRCGVELPGGFGLCERHLAEHGSPRTTFFSDVYSFAGVAPEAAFSCRSVAGGFSLALHDRTVWLLLSNGSLAELVGALRDAPVGWHTIRRRFLDPGPAQEVQAQLGFLEPRSSVTCSLPTCFQSSAGRAWRGYALCPTHLRAVD